MNLSENLELKTFVISLEDLILAKLIWSKESRSEIQMRDIKNILSILGGQLDRGYMEKWAEKLDILKQLKEYDEST